ncbi:Transglycosylase SLT domain-containing protein [Roseateles sp. YR242]|uniref:lytic transglycosylase domain-containing protein n=1 Tax=Roseateles sp. YR242 TaxID=1855305 RepID=UPI0008BB8BCE|nr:lytic transglycosylase domain-containing protein [Roseateles sp. YR242]SEK25199.1 Transglycosylase SLT domain-containing protein [Roseateles sp. YR242]
MNERSFATLQRAPRSAAMATAAVATACMLVAASPCIAGTHAAMTTAANAANASNAIVVTSANASATTAAAATADTQLRDTPAADTVLRYRCLLIDGTTHLLIDDPRERHPELAQDCTLVRVALAPVIATPEQDRPPWVGFAAQVIQGPGGAAGATLSAMPAAVATLVQDASTRHRLDPALVSALIYVESRYRTDARSPKGALGLMQLMPATAARYGVRTPSDLLDPRVNVDVGVRHLRALHDRYDGRVDLILAAYNAGEGAVQRYGQRVPPYAETEDYVRRITALVGVPENASTP